MRLPMASWVTGTAIIDSSKRPMNTNEISPSSAGPIKAKLLDATHPPRIGLKGTAKVFGERVSLFYYLLRRPLAAARQFVGL